MYRFIPFVLIAVVAGCSPEIQSASGAKMAVVGKLPIDGEGRTAEQASITNKIRVEADPNKIWHLYIISPYSGKVLLYSTVKGKITSSGKRLTPKMLDPDTTGMSFEIGGTTMFTSEIPSEDGTFGESSEYIYWVDDKGRNRRQFVTGGQIIHVSDQELSPSELLGDS